MSKDSEHWSLGAAYEPYVGRWSRLVARELVSTLGVPATSQWLDVGRGTGALSRVILEIAAPREVGGVDPSQGYLDFARAEVTDRRARFELGTSIALWTDAGLRDVNAWAIDVPTRFRDFDDYWFPFLGGQGPAPGYAASLDDSQRAALRDHLHATLPTAPDGSIPLIWFARRGR